MALKSLLQKSESPENVNGMSHILSKTLVCKQRNLQLSLSCRGFRHWFDSHSLTPLFPYRIYDHNLARINKTKGKLRGLNAPGLVAFHAQFNPEKTHLFVGGVPLRKGVNNRVYLHFQGLSLHGMPFDSFSAVFV